MELWKTEPNQKDWFAFGLHCEILRAGSIEEGLGHLCGYVDLPPSHPIFGKDYNSIEVDVHGRLTFSKARPPFWRVGFDCAHSGDLVPGMFRYNRAYSVHATYRTFDYVESETNRLAEQLARMRPQEGDDE